MTKWSCKPALLHCNSARRAVRGSSSSKIDVHWSEKRLAPKPENPCVSRLCVRSLTSVRDRTFVGVIGAQPPSKCPLLERYWSVIGAKKRPAAPFRGQSSVFFACACTMKKPALPLTRRAGFRIMALGCQCYQHCQRIPRVTASCTHHANSIPQWNLCVKVQTLPFPGGFFYVEKGTPPCVVGRAAVVSLRHA